MKKDPVIAISLGDPSGIAPEIVVQTLSLRPISQKICVFGHWPTLQRTLAQLAPDLNIELVASIEQAKNYPLAMLHCGPDTPPLDSQCIASAEAQFESLEKAVDAVIAGSCSALVTGPVSKHSIASLRPDFTGHTEYLAKRVGLRPDDVTMTFVSSSLAVGLVTTHEPIRNVPGSVTTSRLERTLKHIVAILKQLLPDRFPRIGVAALNPHAGEDGVIGKEEVEIIGPFCENFSKNSDFSLWGPIPAETLFREAFRGRFDGIIAMYHDQAMIPLKLGGVGQMVNITLGLPFIRTSPDHGTAFDIARTGAANPKGMQLALELAARLISF